MPAGGSAVEASISSRICPSTCWTLLTRSAASASTAGSMSRRWYRDVRQLPNRDSSARKSHRSSKARAAEHISMTWIQARKPLSRTVRFTRWMSHMYLRVMRL